MQQRLTTLPLAPFSGRFAADIDGVIADSGVTAWSASFVTKLNCMRPDEVGYYGSGAVGGEEVERPKVSCPVELTVTEEPRRL